MDDIYAATGDQYIVSDASCYFDNPYAYRVPAPRGAASKEPLAQPAVTQVSPPAPAQPADTYAPQALADRYVFSISTADIAIFLAFCMILLTALLLRSCMSLNWKMTELTILIRAHVSPGAAVGAAGSS